MATGKRYYWIKLKESFMRSETVDYFMSLPDGANYVVLYELLCLLTINTNGRLEAKIGELLIPFDVSKIQRETKWFTKDTIRKALDLYKSAGLIYKDAAGVLVLVDHKDLVGSETDYAKQKKTQRDAAKEKNGGAEMDKNESETADTSVDRLEDKTGDNVRDNIGDKSADNSVDNVHTEIRDIEIRDKRIRDKERTHKNEGAALPGDAPLASGKAAAAGKKKDEVVVYQVPLNDGSMHDVTQSDLEQYRKLYPNVDVDQEIRNLIGWNQSNPRRRKTKSGIRSHITSWLARSQNSGRGSYTARMKPVPTMPDVDETKNPFI